MNEKFTGIPIRLIRTIDSLSAYNQKQLMNFVTRCRIPSLTTTTDRIQYYLGNILGIKEI
jgi:hypothetical protein